MVSVPEMWRDDVVEKSWQVLENLKTIADFVLIGGWGVYLWTRKLKSRDIDLYIDQPNFYKLQSELQQRNYAVKRNVRLRKFEAIIGDVEVDIYTPFMCNLAIPCSDIFNKKLYSVIERFKVAIPETMILLKANAALQRWHTEKGVKDRADIISLLIFVDIKVELLKQILGKYDKQHTLLNTIKRTISESRSEYKFLGLTYERDGVKLKSFIETILKP
jgi:hypothetical protein